MKSYDFDACVYDGEIYCNECLPDGATTEDASPIFADSEWNHAPVCCNCGEVHEYMNILPDEVEDDLREGTEEE